MSWNSTAHPRRWSGIINYLAIPRVARQATHRNDSSQTEAMAMRRKLIPALILAFGIVSFSGPLLAHHGTAALETDKRDTMQGTVTEEYGAKPHCLVQC